MTETPRMGRQERSTRLAEVLGAFSFASSLGIGLPMEHGVRSCYIGMHLARKLELSSQQTEDVYWTELLKDAGCTCWTSPIAMAILGDEIAARKDLFFEGDPTDRRHAMGWTLRHMASSAPMGTRFLRIADFVLHGDDFWREGFQGACQVAQRIAWRLGMSAEVQDSLQAIFEQWDGKGMPNGAKGEEIPIISRIVFATTFLEFTHQTAGREATLRLAKSRRATAFDPDVVDAFLELTSSPGFWEGLEYEGIWDEVLAMEPRQPTKIITEDEMESAVLAIADFADLKSPHTASHSRHVGGVAETIARRMHLPEAEVVDVRRAAMLHDVGLVAVPSFVINKPEHLLTSAERESMRLHPYHGERILARVPALGPLSGLIGYHHERMDGSGYYHGVQAGTTPLGSRIIAVADSYGELTQGTSDVPGIEPEQAAAAIRERAGRTLYSDACEALAADIDGVASRRRNAGAEWPVGLTNREVEVLRFACNGWSRKRIAKELVLTENTVRHHLEHIYNKIGVSNRAAATLFAIEHDLLIS